MNVFCSYIYAYNGQITILSFHRKWEDYKNGFGNFQSSKDEFWLGNDHIHALLSDGKIWITSLSLLLFCSTIIFSKSSLGEHTMKIELMDWKGGKSYAMYDNFRVSDEKVS